MHARPLIALPMALLFSTTAFPQNAPAIEEAHRAYYLGQRTRSLALYEGLAAAGSAEAAERAGFMLQQGSESCGRPSARESDRAMRLLLQAAHAGRPGAAFLLNVLDNTD